MQDTQLKLPASSMHDPRAHAAPALDRLDAASVEVEVARAAALTRYLYSSLVSDDALWLQPDALRQPLIFYLGHPATFWVNKLMLASVDAQGLDAQGLDPELEDLFARGVDPSTASKLDRRDDWPTPSRVRGYVEEARGRALRAVHALDWSRTDSDAPTWAVLMAIEHERVHFETSSMLFRQLPLASLRRPEGWRYERTDLPAPAEAWVEISAGQTHLGRGPELPVFGWDADFGARVDHVPAFTVSRDLVTNAAYAEFVEAGGYEEPRFWTEEGWAWRVAEGATMPRFWRRAELAGFTHGKGGAFRYRAIFDELALPLAWPAEVNAHEADAYCRFRGARLPTEAEWSRLVDVVDPARADRVGLTHHLNLRGGSPAPVGAADVGTGRAVHDVRGNVWQWLADELRPLPGFRPHRLYEDFSAPYFDADHVMMRGGSWATTGAGATPYYRCWFRRHFHQHAGFRLAQRSDSQRKGTGT